MSRGIHGEIEFEFRDDDDGRGEFLACGKVIASLRGLLARGQIDEAASLFAACAENVGDELIADISTGGASSKTMRALAQMFYLAKDYRRAASCATVGKDLELAARCYEDCGELEHAAAYYEQAGEPAKAAALFERNLNFERAAELYLRIPDYPRAAENLERAGRLYQAGTLYLKLARWDRAVDALQRVPLRDPAFGAASQLVGQVLERTGNQEQALRRYAEVTRNAPLDRSTLPVHLRLAAMLADRGQVDRAAQVVDRVVAFDPQHDGARELLAELHNVRRVSRPGAESIPIELELELGADDAPPDLPPARARDANRAVGVDHDFEFLRRVPLFARLSLDEQKYVQSLCDKVQVPTGAALITQGQPGEALYVLIRGAVEVCSLAPGADKTVLGTLGPGAHVGEMSLLDDAPTSASILAVQPVLAFRLARARFDELLRANERIQLRIYTELVQTLVRRLREANTKLTAREA